jgi:hypothetical protein
VSIAAAQRKLHADKLLIAAYKERCAAYQARLAVEQAEAEAEAQANTTEAMLARLTTPLDPFVRVTLEDKIRRRVLAERQANRAAENDRLRQERDGV